MKRTSNEMLKEPAWKLALMNSSVLSAKPDEKGYLPSYLDGIFPGGREAMMPGGKFYRMYSIGSGGELKMKNGRIRACAVYSSSMLVYNFFHWICPECPLRFSDGKTYDKVYFEVKMPVLKTHPASPANMDVVLVSNDCHSVLCFESKLSEYTKLSDVKFPSAYLDSKNYFNNHFVDDFVNYIKNNKKEEHVYNEGIAQMLKHLIAITNLHQSNYAMADMLALNDFIEPEVAQQLQRVVLNIKFSNVIYILGSNQENGVPINKAMDYISTLAHFRSTASFDDTIWQYYVLPNYAYNYNDMFAIMRSQMPDGLADYLEARYPDLCARNEKTCPM